MSDPKVASAMANIVVPQERLAILCVSGEWDRLYAAFSVANGALANGQQVDMFFAFWAASTMQATRGTPRRGALGRLIGWMMPRSLDHAPLSRMHFGGLGRRFFGFLMRREGMDDLPSLVTQAEELGARFHYCDSSMRILGFGKLDPSTMHGQPGGVTTFLALARGAQVLFI